MAIGKKAQAYFRFRHQPVEQQFVGMSDRPTYEDAQRGGRSYRAAVPRGRGRPRADSIDPDPLREQPGRRRPAKLLPVLASPEAAWPTALRGLSRCASGRRFRRDRRRFGDRRLRLACARARARAQARLLRVRAGRRAPTGAAHPAVLGSLDLRRAAWRRPLRSTLLVNGRCRRPPRTPKSCSRPSGE